MVWEPSQTNLLAPGNLYLLILFQTVCESFEHI